MRTALCCCWPLLLWAVFLSHVEAFSRKPSNSFNSRSSQTYALTDPRGTEYKSVLAQQKPFVNRDTIEFNNKLNRMAKSFDKRTALEVETLVRQTLDNVQRGSEVKIQPNVVTFVAAINAWARCTRKDSGEKAEGMLDLLLDLSKDSDNVYFLDLKPNAIAYNAAITAWIRSGLSLIHI